jgi:uncharacterized protein YbjT (DUF2867 family)
VSDRPLIAVLGATGAQGGGLVRAILADPQRRFAARALTRKPEAPAARALAQAGAEVVFADLDDAFTLDAAFTGAHGVFAVTNYWEHLSPEREVTQAGNVARAAASARVRHVVWSTLVDTRRRVPLADPRLPTLMGRYKVPHYDGKGEADALFAEVPTTFLRTSFYWDNLIHFGLGPKRAADGVAELALPLGDCALPGVAAEDIGACALGVFARFGEFVGATLGIAGEHVTGARMARSLAGVLGEPVRYRPVSFQDYVALGYPGGHDMANMFHYKHDFNAEYRAEQPVARSRLLHPGLLDFEAWAARHAHRFSLPRAA